MTWVDHHRRSEQLASEAEVALLKGDPKSSEFLYVEAAKQEELALEYVGDEKTRTFGITAVSTVSLFHKGKQLDNAETLAHRYLGSGRLPGFAKRQLEQSLDRIRTDLKMGDTPTSHILFSLMGGELVPGGAPLNLITGRHQKIQNLLYRTSEKMNGLPHRRTGSPSRETNEAYRPWVFQTPPGSYRFAVTLLGPKQLDMFRKDEVPPEQVVDHLYDILRTCAESPDQQLPRVVPDREYQRTFLKLARDLAPTGKGFEQMIISRAIGEEPVILNQETRRSISQVLRQSKAANEDEQGTEKDIQGVLRALHLDRDWIEITVEGRQSLRIDEVTEEVDDRIGPMVNQPVVVRVFESGERLRFIDIEADE